MAWFKRRRKMRSERLARRRRKQLIFRLGIFVVVVAILFGTSIWFLHRPSLQINEILIHGNNVVSDSDLIKITEEVLQGKYAFLLPRTNTFIYPEEELEDSILTSFKQIESVDLVRTNFRTLALEIEEQRPFALWCLDGVESILDNCYFINKEGLIFSRAPNFTGNVFFRFYGDLENVDPIGEYYLKKNNGFSRMSVLIDSIKDLNVVPVELHPLDEPDLELYMEDGSKILFTHEQSLSEVKDNLRVVLESETFKGEEIEDIEYIDLRFGNKVYFKLK